MGVATRDFSAPAVPTFVTDLSVPPVAPPEVPGRDDDRRRWVDEAHLTGQVSWRRHEPQTPAAPRAVPLASVAAPARGRARC